MQVDHPGQMGVGDVRTEDVIECVLLQCVLGDGQVDRLGVVSSDIGVFPGLAEDELFEVITRHADYALLLYRRRESALKEFVVHKLTDQRG